MVVLIIAEDVGGLDVKHVGSFVQNILIEIADFEVSSVFRLEVLNEHHFGDGVSSPDVVLEAAKEERFSFEEGPVDFVEHLSLVVLEVKD